MEHNERQFIGNPTKKLRHEERLAEELLGDQGERELLDRMDNPFQDGATTDAEIEENARFQIEHSGSERDDYASWDRLDGLSRPVGADEDDFLTANELAAALGYAALDDLPKDHPLKSLDGSDFLTNKDVENVHHFETTSRPAIEAARLYDELKRGDSPAATAVKLKQLDVAGLVHLQEQIREHGAVDGFDSIEIKMRLQELQNESDEIAETANQDELSEFFSEAERQKRADEYEAEQSGQPFTAGVRATANSVAFLEDEEPEPEPEEE